MKNKSPEMVINKSYDYRTDIWALGILLFVLLDGDYPYSNEDKKSIMKEIK